MTSVKKTLGKGGFCRVPEKQHSANHLALGKEPISGSDYIYTSKPKPSLPHYIYTTTHFASISHKIESSKPALLLRSSYLARTKNQIPTRV